MADGPTIGGLALLAGVGLRELLLQPCPRDALVDGAHLLIAPVADMSTALLRQRRHAVGTRVQVRHYNQHMNFPTC